jgi:hypothetical protein
MFIALRLIKIRAPLGALCVRGKPVPYFRWHSEYHLLGWSNSCYKHVAPSGANKETCRSIGAKKVLIFASAAKASNN